jgi:7-cyano-7-deazaguanine synthase in queuosine biosynthesis
MNALRYVGKNGCQAKVYREFLAEAPEDHTILDVVSKRPNITLRATINRKPLYLGTSPEVRDFRDVGIMGYILDTLQRRKDAPDYWSRQYDCVVPVRNPEAWGANTELLQRLLATLAGDRYSFQWLPAVSMPSHPKHNARVPKGFDAVCLFSGGIDSLLGAYGLLKKGKSLLLVGHQSEPTTAKAQKDVFLHLQRLFPGKACLIQFRLSVSQSAEPQFPLPDRGENTYRVRSFLFLALAVAVANMAGVHELHVPENGLIALNPPLDLSRLGTCSTRTAHPRFLKQFVDLAKALGVYTGTLVNPFLYESKTDMLQCIDARLVPAVQRSVSCAHASLYQDKGVRHCGYCVPCIHRRAAMAEANLDRAADYAFDVFKDIDALTTTTRLDFISLTQFARKFQDLRPLQKQGIVLAQGYFSPDLGGVFGPHPAKDYSPWVQMLERWTARFLALIQASAPAVTKRAIGMGQSPIA